MPSNQVAKKRFVPNVPVRAGTLYKTVINGKDYIVRAKYNKTLPEFDPIWFDNTSPKEYRFSNTASINVSLMPMDQIIVGDSRVVNNHLGFLEPEESAVLLADTVSHKVGSAVLVVDDGTNRFRHLEIRPYGCINYEATKYFQIGDETTLLTFRVKNPTEQVYIIEVKETFTPVLAGASTSHRLHVYFEAFTPSYQGTAPNSTTSTYAVYNIPNSLTKRKLTFTKSGNTIIIKMENYV